jgi:hypothetical protein
MKQAEKLLQEKNLAIVKSQKLNKVLVEHLFEKGVTSRKLKPSEETEAKEKYNNFLEQLYKSNKQREMLGNEINEKKMNALEKKDEICKEIHHLKDGELELCLVNCQQN